ACDQEGAYIEALERRLSRAGKRSICNAASRSNGGAVHDYFSEIIHSDRYAAFKGGSWENK
ncbi:MAG: hypothetical protein ABI785_11585, partial [Gemmatimonadales bacterium]